MKIFFDHKMISTTESIETYQPVDNNIEQTVRFFTSENVYWFVLNDYWVYYVPLDSNKFREQPTVTFR